MGLCGRLGSFVFSPSLVDVFVLSNAAMIPPEKQKFNVDKDNMRERTQTSLYKVYQRNGVVIRWRHRIRWWILWRDFVFFTEFICVCFYGRYCSMIECRSEWATEWEVTMQGREGPTLFPSAEVASDSNRPSIITGGKMEETVSGVGAVMGLWRSSYLSPTFFFSTWKEKEFCLLGKRSREVVLGCEKGGERNCSLRGSKSQLTWEMAFGEDSAGSPQRLCSPSEEKRGRERKTCSYSDCRRRMIRD